jgi:sulfatase maturation enzyme AslB (radical SAM superfamily)
VNIIITTRCHKLCDFCFMGDLRNSTITDMTFDDFKKCIAELKSQSIWSVHLLGGEATLHPHLIDFIEYTASQGMRTALITNLLCSDDFIDFANDNPLAFEPIMVNTDIPGNYKNGHYELFIKNLSRIDWEPKPSKKDPKKTSPHLNWFGRITLGLDMKEDMYDYLFDYKQYGMDTLGISLDMTVPRKQFINNTKLGEIVVKIVQRFNNGGITVLQDGCGMPLCMFTGEHRKILAANLRYVNSGCSFAIDVLPNLDVIPCMMLQGIRARLEDGLNNIITQFNKLHENVDAQECAGCPHFYKICAGFCLNGRI